MSVATKLGVLAVVIALPRASAGQDTVRIRADNAPVWGTSVPLVRVFRIGSVEGPPEYAFGRIRSVAPRGDQSVFVYDEQDVQIRLYDANGKFVKAVGRKGAGPGEYANVIGMAVVGDTMLVVGDYSNGRVSYFNRDGVFVRSIPLKFGASSNSRSFAIDAAGRFYVQMVVQGATPTAEPTTIFVRSNAEGKVIDSLIVPPRNAGPGFIVDPTSEGERWNFMPATVSVVTPLGGIVSGRTEKFAIAMPVSGKPTIVERTHTPVPMTPAERAEWEALISQWDATVYTAKGRTPPSRPAIPDVKPPFRSLVTDTDGRVWVEMYTTSTKRRPNEPADGPIRAQITWREVATFDVLSAAGQYLGHVVLPQNSVLLAARGNRIWVRTEGESGEHVLVAYRVGASGT